MTRMRCESTGDGFEVDHVVVIDESERMIWIVLKAGLRFFLEMLSTCARESEPLKELRNLKMMKEKIEMKSRKKLKTY